MAFPILWACMARRSVPTVLRALAILGFTIFFANSAFAQFTITLQPNTLPAATAGTPYNQTVTAVGGNAPYTFDYKSGSPTLPAGLTLHSSGLIDGTPVSGGSVTVQIEATDSGANTGFRTYTFNTGTAGGMSVNPGSLPDGSQGVAYSQTVTGSGGTGPYTFSLGSGSLPAGLSLASNGAITGTPTGTGASTFTINGLDSAGNTGSRSYTVNIGGNILTVNPSTLSNGTQGSAYSQTVSATGGTGPYTFSVSSGSLPTGLSLNGATGDITGTPTTPGAYSFTIRALDSVNNTGTRSYTVNIGSNILTVNPGSPLPNGTRGTAYGATFTASGGTGPYTFAVSSGALPAGLSLASNGALSGTPTAAGTYSFDVTATDSLFNTGTRSYSLTIDPAPLTINPASLPNGTVGTAYNQTIVASNGTAPYSYAVIAGALPTGLSLNGGTGAITGTPTTPGSYSFTIQGTDATPITGSRSYTVQIGSNILTIAPATLPNGTRGSAYNQTVTASGGTGPYTYAVTSGALPTGLALNTSTGAITGTPSGTGASAFTITATDSLANTGSRAYSVNIGTVSLTVNPATLPAPIAGRPYAQTVSATGGTGPYTFSIVSGSLPTGLTLNASTGVISGTTSGLTSATFTVQAFDANGNIGTRAYTLTSRPDPALDPEVQGLIASQVAAAQRFATAQIENVSQHMMNLHGHFNPCSISFGMAPQLSQPTSPLYYQPPDPYTGPPRGLAVSKDPYSGPPPGWPGPPPVPQPAPAVGCADWASSLALWTAGSFSIGSMTPNGQTASNKFLTSGLTAGVDWRLTDTLIAGVAVGYGGDRSDIGTNGTRSDSSSFSGTLYASFRPLDPFFLDASAGYGSLNFDNRRFVTGEGSLVSGTRTGSYWFGSLTASVELTNGAFKFTPYARADYTSATLNSYAEGGSSAQLLTYDSMKVSAFSGAVGLRGSIDIPISSGTMTPFVRLEYKETSQSDYSQNLYYSDLGPGISSAFSAPSNVRSMTTTAVGLRFRATGGMTVDLEYGFAFGTDSYKAQSIKAALRVPF
ncbi:MAG: putative Ig domain-containing protein [Pseudolabrys sp.]|nr:putative Ig domain-containing protein [Pseudolabrys sp.]